MVGRPPTGPGTRGEVGWREADHASIEAGRGALEQYFLAQPD